MTEQLGVLLLSCVRHQGYYAPLIAKHTRLRIAAVADEADLPERWHTVNREFAAQYGVEYIPDVAAALARPDVALVSICSEPTRHAQLALKAARAGKHIWVDKPMAITMEEADALVNAVEAAGVRFTYVHFLYAPMIRHARQLIERELGSPRAIHADFVIGRGLQSGTVEDFRLVVDPKLSGGGEATNLLGYTVDYIRYLAGADVTQVYASMGTHFFEPHREFNVEDLATVALTLQNDLVATTIVGRAPTMRAALGDFGLRIYTDNGMVALDHNQPRLSVYGSNETAPRGMPFYEEPGDDAVEPLLDAFVDCIINRSEPLRGVRDGRRLIEILTAAYRSSASGSAVHVPLVN